MSYILTHLLPTGHAVRVKLFGMNISQSKCIDIGRCVVSANETTLHPNNNLKKSKPL